MSVEPTYQDGTVVGHPEGATQPVNEKDDAKHHEDHDRKMNTPLEREVTQQHMIGGGPSDDESLLEEHPTPEELDGPTALRRISAPIPLAVYTVAFVELCERFSYYGTQVVFSNFVNKPLPNGSLPGSNPRTGAGGSSDQGISGALGQGPQTANAINTFNQFWIYCIPLLGAYMADEHWGRYKTICISIAIAIVGHIILVMSAIPPVITRTPASFGTFIVGLIIMGIGTGGFKPNISPLVVEQIPVKTLQIQTLPSGERVIVDPTITQSRIYHYFYLFINIGALIGQLSMVYAEKYVGFWLSFTLPTVVFFICPGIMWWGRKRYRQASPQGSVVSKSFRLLFRATKGRWSINPLRTWRNMHDGTFWASVKPSAIPRDQRPAWYTFDDAWVDEVRRGFAACAVFAWYPLFWLTYNQIINNLTAQATTMQLNGLPSDVLNNLNPFTLLIFIPICDVLLYPTLRKYGIRFSPIKKITLGFFTGTAAMMWALGVQVYIYRLSPCGYQANSCVDENGNPLPAPINVWAQTGSYVLIGLSEIFASITSLEYAFSKAPTNMRSMVQAVALFTSAISAAIGQAMNPLSADPLLIWNYGVAGALSAIGGIFFMLQFRGLDAEEDELNMLAEGRVVVNKDIETYGEEAHGHGSGNEIPINEKQGFTSGAQQTGAQQRPVADEIKE